MSSEAGHLRDVTRREVLTQMGPGLIAATISTAWGPISPAEARAKGVPLRSLNTAEARTLEALGDVLLPGAREAGIAHYVDEQLSRDNPLFAVTYMDYQGAYVDFYRQGLQALEQQSFGRYRRRFERCSMRQQAALIRQLSQSSPADWQGPPAPLFYFVTRSDAIDVYYGTMQGFARLGIPYMAHIMPPERW